MSGIRMGMDITTRMDQKLILAPRMIQSMEILQLPIVDLLAKIEGRGLVTAALNGFAELDLQSEEALALCFGQSDFTRERPAY